jgi:hypothetical protein
LELTAKAHRLRLPVAEIPTIWLDRTLGKSRFDLAGFVPAYLRWYRFAYGRRLTLEQLTRKREASAKSEQPATVLDTVKG